jgi:CRISP-associated protein Cas1
MAIVEELILNDFGLYLGKHSERLQVFKEKQRLHDVPLLHLKQVLIIGQGISLSADVVRVCCERGIPIHFVSPTGEPYAGLHSAGLTGTVLTRREQMAAYLDGRGVTLARQFAAGKIANQAALLRYMAKYRKDADPELFQELRWVAGELLDHVAELEKIQGARIDDVRDLFLSVEGRAAQRYWTALKRVLPEEYGWPGREQRGGKDGINAALNYGYGILYSQVERALVLAGLDPYGGFVHVDRPGKPSLALDLIEEFRAPVVDRTVVGLANHRVALEQDAGGLLTEATRRFLAERVLEHLGTPEKYEGKRYPLATIIQRQARHLATFVRGDRPDYEPFRVKW